LFALTLRGEATNHKGFHSTLGARILLTSVSSIGTATFTATQTAVDTHGITDTQTATTVGTATQNNCTTQGNQDLGACTNITPTTSGYCNFANTTPCVSDGDCFGVKGDFCRDISTTDGSGRLRPESCVASSGSPWGSCKHGVVTANTTCGSSGDTSCNTALPGDFCAEGQPAKMCADSGLWCASNLDCTSPDTCVAATSRMMITKRALRRAVTANANKINFGFMNTYQGKGVPATATDATTAIFPYVKLQSCASSKDITETKLLTRGELQKANCFSLASGPSSSCTIDYGGAGAVNSNATLNQITYALVGTNDSRWAIPRSDGSGKYNHQDASWSSCSASAILPACRNVQTR